MNYWEMYYVKEYNSKIPNGYNMTDGGDSTYERTEETKAKVAAAKRGKPNPKTADALRGRKRPAEVGAKVAAALRGRKLSEETKTKLSEALRGRKLSEETRKKMSDAQRGKKLSEETKARMSAALKTSEKAKIARTKVAAALRGRKLSEEIKVKMSDAQRGKKLSEETKARIGAAQKNDPKKSKAVQALKDGNVIMEFPSAMEAKRHGFDASAVVKCCRGKWKFYKGYIWRYAV